ncbi:conserved hypothetical protein [Allomeiothermus silvanus DSM 9946]|uniref:Uncharacterized protein n=1 Tax=Allomeiothermus silvanus (strain ATCC 700542 / DSM 9946 / NBRC 106475 / NCIMB 13440 / VI-R2) TaxID=526227 RepID=D7BGF6_ALLS1|nr:hypothetical protein [Allomeiothermus silvanus]ADH63772.1 conserved hypothetical protein [Allomeiothermus silvanus DSM 9946]
MIDPETLKQIERLLALPREIARVGRRLTALRDEKRKLEEDLKKRAVVIRVRARNTAAYEQLKGADAREDWLQLQVLEDTDYEEDSKRLKQLAVAIDKAQVEKDELQDEHQSLRAALEGRYAELLERALTEAKMAQHISTGRVNLA